MEYESKELIKIYEHLLKKGIKTSEAELLKTIFEFAAEKEDELLLTFTPHYSPFSCSYHA